MEELDKKKQVYEYRKCINTLFVEDENHIKNLVMCNREFFISVSEQEYYESKGMHLPKRCYFCRLKNRTKNDENKTQG